MNSFAFPSHPQNSLPIIGSDKFFPVHRIYCVARNYANHAIEMGHNPKRELPFFFEKSSDNLRIDGYFPYPAISNDVHHEIELMVALKKGGASISVAEAPSLIFGFGIALDMTLRDIQAEAKTHGRPWDIAKSFDYSAPATGLTPIEKIGLLEQSIITLHINNSLTQSGNIDQMIWKIPELIADLSHYFTLKPGDIILTGTPAGVGPVKKGDKLLGQISGLPDLRVEVI